MVITISLLKFTIQVLKHGVSNQPQAVGVHIQLGKLLWAVAVVPVLLSYNGAAPDLSLYPRMHLMQSGNIVSAGMLGDIRLGIVQTVRGHDLVPAHLHTGTMVPQSYCHSATPLRRKEGS